jgi:hypothetical protein
MTDRTASCRLPDCRVRTAVHSPTQPGLADASQSPTPVCATSDHPVAPIVGAPKVVSAAGKIAKALGFAAFAIEEMLTEEAGEEA